MNPTLYPIPGQDLVNNVLKNSSNTANAITQSSNMPSSQNDSNSVLSQISNMSPATQQDQPTSDNSNWFTKLLPTIGSLGGGLLGGLVPIPGLDIATGVAGAGAGGAFGKSLENMLEGKDTSLEDLGGSALEGAGGQVLGGVLGKVGGAVGGLIGKVGEKGLAKEAVDAAAQATSNDAKASQLNFGVLSSDMQRNLNLGTNQKLVTAMGGDATNPYDMKTVANAVEPLNAKYSEALSQTKPVDMTDFNTTAAKMTGFDASRPVSPIDTAISSYLNPGGGVTRSITDTMAPTDVRALQQEIGTQIGNTQKIINNATNNGLTNTQSESDLQTLHSLYNMLGNKIKTPELNAAISAQIVTPAERTALVSEHGDTLGNNIADTITNSKQASDYLNPMQQYTQMNHASNMAIDDIENATGTARASQRAQFAANGNAVTPANVAANTPSDIIGTINHPIAKALSTVMKIGSQGGQVGKAAVNLGSVLQRIAPLAGAATGQTIANSPNYAGPANANTAIGGNMQPTGIGSSGDPMTDILNSNSPNTLALKQLLLLGAHGGAYNAPAQMQAFAAPAAEELKSLNNVNSAQSQLSSLVKLYNQAGGAQGPIAGNLNRISSMFTGGAAGSYDGQAQQLAKQISDLTGTQVNAPSLNMDQSTANSVLQQLQAALASYGGGGGISSLGSPR